jgi:hypothetical protein
MSTSETFFEFGHSPSIHLDRDRYPMMDEIIRKVSRRLKTRLGKCEAVGDLALIRSRPLVLRGRHATRVFSDGDGRGCSVGRGVAAALSVNPTGIANRWQLESLK